VCRNISEAREDLGRLRSTIIEVARDFELAPIAASTHPFARWQTQRHTEKERYEVLTRDMQAAARRLLICGMHVHVGIDDDDQRIDIINQMTYFLPFLLALSCSSPFWLGEDTGLKSYRLTVFDSLPRTRLPERFASFGDYQQHVDVLTKGGLIEDATKIWWDMRPSARYPTVEMRITDVCTRMEDALSIAALTVSLIAMLSRVRSRSMRWRIFAHMLVYENRWRAMRYGYDNGMLDFVRAETIPFPQLLDEVIGLIREDAHDLGCLPEVEASRRILDRGTSAHRQLEVYAAAKERGASHEEGLHAVVDFLVSETGYGLDV
jgi:carboxylate-amine ligase